MLRTAIRLAVAICVAAGMTLLAQSPVAPTAAPASPTSPPPSSSTAQAATPASDQSISGGRLHGSVKSGSVPLPGSDRHSAEHTDRQTLFDHVRYHWRLVPDDSAKWTVCDSHAVRGVCAGFAGGAAQCIQSRSDCEFLVDSGFARGATTAAGGRAIGRAGDSTAGGEWRAEPEPGECVELGHRDASGKRRHERRGAAVGRRQLGFQFGFGGDQWAGGCSESVGRRGYGPAARRVRNVSRAESAIGRANRQWSSGAVWRWRIWGRGRVRRVRRRRFWWRRPRRIWRRTRRVWQFSRIQSGQPHGAIFWMGSNSALNAEPFSLRGQVAGTAGVGDEPLRADVYQRTLHSRTDETERQRQRVSDAVRLAQLEPAG